MNHTEHIKRIRLIAIVSMCIHICVLTIILFAYACSDLSDESTLYICVILVVLTGCSCIPDVKIYLSDKPMGNTSNIAVWKQVSQIRIILISFTVIALILMQILVLERMDGRMILPAILFCGSGVTYQHIYKQFVDIHKDCIIQCTLSVLFSVK